MHMNRITSERQIKLQFKVLKQPCLRLIQFTYTRTLTKGWETERNRICSITCTWKHSKHKRISFDSNACITLLTYVCTLEGLSDSRHISDWIFVSFCMGSVSVWPQCCCFFPFNSHQQTTACNFLMFLEWKQHKIIVCTEWNKQRAMNMKYLSHHQGTSSVEVDWIFVLFGHRIQPGIVW